MVTSREQPENARQLEEHYSTKVKAKGYFQITGNQRRGYHLRVYTCANTLRILLITSTPAHPPRVRRDNSDAKDAGHSSLSKEGDASRAAVEFSWDIFCVLARGPGCISEKTWRRKWLRTRISEFLFFLVQWQSEKKKNRKIEKKSVTRQESLVFDCLVVIGEYTCVTLPLHLSGLEKKVYRYDE